MSNGITTDVILSSNSAHSIWFLILTNCMDDISTASAVVLQDPIIKSQKAASYPTCHVSSKGPSIFLMQLGRGITFKQVSYLEKHLFAISTTEPFGADATSKTHLSILLEQEPEILALHMYDDKGALLY